MKLNFSRRNVATHSVDMMFCEVIGCKTWVRHRSIRADEVPSLVNLLQIMRTESIDDAMNDTSASETKSLFEPGISAFFYRNYALKAQSISPLGFVSCEIFQSLNDNLSVGTFIEFND